VTLFPIVEPYAGGMLDVGDGHSIAWDIAGAPNGTPAVVLHGGPGQGSSPNMRRGFDPARYRVVLFDQRGCGRSTPLGSLANNTTHALVEDIERLRTHLGIERWVVTGGSWGSTLALAYALRHPERVSAIVLANITTGRRSEADWLYRGAARFFPEAWKRFRNHVGDDDVIAAYASRLQLPEVQVQLAAARAWCEWENAILSLEPHPSGLLGLADADAIAFARICAHYLRHGAWLEEGELIRNAHQLAKIPGVLIHGRRDLSCPVETAFELSMAWPGSELIVVDDAGHLRSDAKRAALVTSLARFA
jgi:proline iminopeptidase